MKNALKSIAAVLAFVVTWCTTAFAYESGALVEALVKKGVLSDQEAEEIRSELAQEYVSTGGGKMQLSEHITRLKLFGDARMRYEYRNGMVVANPSDTTGTFQTGAQNNQAFRTRNRWRYRLRVGADYQFTDNFSSTLRLETGNSGRSTNVTYGDDITNSTNSVFGKSNDGIFVGQAYMTYKPISGMTLVGGKQPVPFVTTNMIWDGDLNPEGFSESYSFKADKFDISFNLGQIYDTNDDRTTARVSNHTAWMLGQQIVAKYTWEKDHHAQIAPTLYTYINTTHTNDAVGANAWYTGNVATITGRSQTNDLVVFDVPVEVQFPVWENPLRLYADVALNIDADKRAWHAGQTGYGSQEYNRYVQGTGNQDTSFRVGFDYGKNKKKGDWKVGYFYQRTEAWSIDTNLTDSDIFDSGVNMQGHCITGSYNFTDFLTGNLCYVNADSINKNLPTGNNGDTTGTDSLGQYQLLQVDLSWKF